MPLKPVHKVARIATIGLTVAGAAFGSVVGLAASGWGGVFVIVPVAAALFAIVGALIGAAIEFAIRLAHPTNYEL
jgi:outer membrane lipoprotein SlyB